MATRPKLSNRYFVEAQLSYQMNCEDRPDALRISTLINKEIRDVLRKYKVVSPVVGKLGVQHVKRNLFPEV